MVGMLIGEERPEVERRAPTCWRRSASRRRSGWFEARRQRWIIGTPDEARATVRRYADAGVERLMLQDFIPRDGDMIDLMAQELIGKV